MGNELIMWVEVWEIDYLAIDLIIGIDIDVECNLRFQYKKYHDVGVFVVMIGDRMIS